MSQIEAVSRKIINIAHDTLLMNLRFLEVAMSSLEWEAIEGSGQIACDGMKIYYDPVLVIRKYKVDQHSIARLYLHVILHMVFHHNFEYSEKDTRLWDYSCDIAVENTIEDLNKKCKLNNSENQEYILYNWKGISFVPYCCYEIADITARSLFKNHCHIVTISEFNKDTKYFENICESLSRDLYCYCISSNTSKYGGTSIIQPSSSEDKYIIKLKGGENDYIVTYDLNISDLEDKTPI